MGWYKFTKTFQGGRKTYIKWIFEDEFRTNKEDILNEYCRDIGENTPGGHSYGWWNVKCDECVPTPDEINEIIKETERSIKYHESYIWNLNKMLLLYHKELEKITEKKDGQED